MQIIDLIYDFDFLESFNLSVPTDTILEDMKDLVQNDWFYDRGLLPSWNLRYSVPMSLIPTKHGLCFNFNMVDASDLFNFDKYVNEKSKQFKKQAHTFRTSQDFNSSRSYENEFLYIDTNTDSEKIDQEFPLHPPDRESILQVSFYTEKYSILNSLFVYDGFLLLMHDTDEFPMQTKFHHLVNMKTCVILTMLPKFTEAHETLQAMSIDE